MNSQTGHFNSTEINSKNHFIVPNRRVSGFIGREDILERIDIGLSSGSGTRVVVLRGLGGQGKTQIALEYCHRARKDNIRSIFWVDATSENTIKKDFEAILGHIRSRADLTQENQGYALVLNKLRDWNEPWLMVFDNHDDPSSFHLPDFMPDGQDGRILITSRHADTAVLAEVDNDIELPGLPRDDACDLLIRQSRVGNAASRNDAYTIVDHLGYHTLAITQAGSYIQTQKIQLSQFIDNYNRQREAILKETPRMSQYRRKIGEAADETALNVFTTWELSYQQLEKLDDENRYKSAILTLFAFFDCQHISQQLFETYCKEEFLSYPDVLRIEEPLLLFVDENKKWDQQKFVDILNDLSRLSLIQSWYRDEENHCHLSLHPLVQDWIRLRASPQLCYDHSLLSAYILATELKHSDSYKSFMMPLPLRQEILSHLNVHDENQNLMVTFKKHKQFNEQLRYNSYWYFTEFYNENGYYKESETVARKWVEASSQEFGPQEKMTIYALRMLANTLAHQRKFKEAFDIDRRILNNLRREHGPEHPEVLLCTHYFAWRLMERGELVKAEKLFRRLIETKTKVLGQNQITTLESRFGLISVIRLLNKLTDAESLCRKLIQDSQRFWGPNNPLTFRYMRAIAVILDDQRRYSAALPYFEEFYAFKLATLGPEHPETLRNERYCVDVRQIVEQRAQRKRIKNKRTSSGSQTSDSESDTGSGDYESDEESDFETYTQPETFGLDDEFVFSNYEQTLLGYLNADTE